MRGRLVDASIYVLLLPSELESRLGDLCHLKLLYGERSARALGVRWVEFYRMRRCSSTRLRSRTGSRTGGELRESRRLRITMPTRSPARRRGSQNESTRFRECSATRSDELLTQKCTPCAVPRQPMNIIPNGKIYLPGTIRARMSPHARSTAANVRIAGSQRTDPIFIRRFFMSGRSANWKICATRECGKEYYRSQFQCRSAGPLSSHLRSSHILYAQIRMRTSSHPHAVRALFY
ncbi:hypothetical protein PENSPDRAFT_38489 [Peniophora sp. CONT]|nr:hypothetical protein PENSPDRAFT_38489 [Peniophora sp. CONT]